MARDKVKKAAYEKARQIKKRDKPCKNCGAVITTPSGNCGPCDKARHKKNWIAGVFHNIKNNKRGLPVLIDAAYLRTLSLTDACRICKHVFNWDEGRGRPSPDRIDAARGYAPGNLWWICSRCNLAKNDATPAELLQVAIQRMFLEAYDQIDDDNRNPATIGGQFSLLCRAAKNCQGIKSLPGTLTPEQKDLCARERLSGAKKRAKDGGLPFSITLEDIQIPEKCPLLGHGFVKGVGEACAQSPSLDRIVPELGYVPGNVQVVSHRANTIKSDTDLLHFLRLTVCMLRVLNGTEIP